MKRNYESPITEVISLEHRDPVLDSASPLVTAAWLTQGGQGDFDYNVEEVNVFE